MSRTTKRRKAMIDEPLPSVKQPHCPECGAESEEVATGYEKGTVTTYIQCPNADDGHHVEGGKWKLAPRERLPRPSA